METGTRERRNKEKKDKKVFKQKSKAFLIVTNNTDTIFPSLFFIIKVLKKSSYLHNSLLVGNIWCLSDGFQQFFPPNLFIDISPISENERLSEVMPFNLTEDDVAIACRESKE